ncbi:MAG: FHA domain-containing protein [Polyangia bacterium]
MTKYRLIHQNSNIEAPSGRFEIGRSNECSLVLDDPSVSRRHATVLNEDGKLFVEDLGSRNGVVVNGERIEGRHLLRDGDRLAIGHQTIRIVAVQKTPDADRTMGLANCPSCGAWMSSNEEVCPQCGARRREEKSVPHKTAEIDLSAGAPSEKRAKSTSGQSATMRPHAVLAALVQKSINMNKHDEAERLLGNMMQSLLERSESDGVVPDGDLLSLNRGLIALAKAARSPQLISRLFALHRTLGVLMPRETVESLYENVRKTGYRSCNEMSRYLDYLARRASEFSPGEKFIHRRLQGLVGLVS